VLLQHSKHVLPLAVVGEPSELILHSLPPWHRRLFWSRYELLRP
jgi:hypothetical protein